jgi:glutaminase
MINAGAIAVTTLIEGQGVDHKFERLLHFVRRLTGNPDITYNTKVARSESETSNLNRSLAYFMREHGVFNGDIEEILALYFKQCAIELNCRDLARLGAVLANNGRDIGGEKLIPADVARICKTFMVTCGMYNASGEFAIEVGIPAKSGVSGGILASVPYHMGIGVLGPALNDKGNSVAGIQILKKISEKWDLSIF